MVPHIKKLLGVIHKQRFIIAIFRGGGGRIRRRSWSKNSFDISIYKSILQYLDPDLEF